MLKSELAKLITIKKNKIIALEMNLALHRNDVARYKIRRDNLVELVSILRENIDILAKPSVIARIGARKEAIDKLEETLKDIKGLQGKIDKAELKASNVSTTQGREMLELKVMEAEIDAPAEVLPFKRRNAG